MNTFADWRRVARPQTDLYDIGVIASVDGLNVFRTTPPDNCASRLGGLIGVYPDKYTERSPAGPDARPCTAEDVGPDWARRQTRYLDAWSTGYDSLTSFIDEFWPFWSAHGGKGCSSGHWIRTREYANRAIYVSVNDLNGCAQGIYHEFAHQRLYALGIQMEQHDGRLLLNTPEELYDSPVRFDIKRPMTAVLHGLYAWLMFTENDYQNYHAGRLVDLQDWMDYSARNIPKIENGLLEVRRFARTTPEGTAFLDGLFEWGYDLVSRCREDMGLV